MSDSVLRAEAKAFIPTFTPHNNSKSDDCSNNGIENEIRNINGAASASDAFTNTQENGEQDTISGRGLPKRNRRRRKKVSSYVSSNSQKFPDRRYLNERKKHLRGSKDNQNPIESFTPNEQCKDDDLVQCRQEPISTNSASKYQSRNVQHTETNTSKGGVKRSKCLTRNHQNHGNDFRMKRDCSRLTESSDPVTIKGNHEKDPHDQYSPFNENFSTIEEKNKTFPWFNAVTRKDIIDPASKHVSNQHDLAEKINQPLNHVEKEASCWNIQSLSSTTSEFIVLRKNQVSVPASEKQIVSSTDCIVTNDVPECNNDCNFLLIKEDMSVLTSRLKSSRNIDITKLRNRWWDILQKRDYSKQNEIIDNNSARCSITT
jgi:hypothetical protein